MEYIDTPKKKKTKIWEIVYWIIFLLIILLTLGPTLSAEGINIPYRFFSVETGSMQPTIKPGDLIVDSTKSDYKVGDVITFRFKGQNDAIYNTHRIVDITQDENGNVKYTTKGDFNTVEDIDKVTPDKIVGKYVFRIPYAGYPLQFVKTVPGFVLLIVIPATVLIYSEIEKVRDEIVKMKLKKENKNNWS